MRRTTRDLIVVALLSAVPAAMGPRAAPADESAGLTVVVVRHAEKAGKPKDDPVLNRAGRRRAARLDRMLAAADVRGLVSTPLRRTRDTLAPLSARHGLEITEVGVRAPGHARRVAEAVRAFSSGVVVVAGHSNTVPAIVRELAGTDPGPIDDATHDLLFIVHLPRRGTPSLLTLRY